MCIPEEERREERAYLKKKNRELLEANRTCNYLNAKIYSLKHIICKMLK